LQRIRGVYDYALYKSTFYLLSYLLTYSSSLAQSTYSTLMW